MKKAKKENCMSLVFTGNCQELINQFEKSNKAFLWDPFEIDKQKENTNYPVTFKCKDGVEKTPQGQFVGRFYSDFMLEDIAIIEKID